MKEHEQLKEICKIIGCKYVEFEYLWDGQSRRVGVREIIFTQQFMRKIESYMEELEWPLWWDNYIMSYLDNPVQYLYNLIKK